MGANLSHSGRACVELILAFYLCSDHNGRMVGYDKPVIWGKWNTGYPAAEAGLEKR